MRNSRYFQNLQRICPQSMKDPKVGNLPPDLLVRARVSIKVLLVWPPPKSLPRDLAQALHVGVLAGECSLECDLGKLLLHL